jgi:hypothetical protein
VAVANSGTSSIAFTFNGVPTRACNDVAGRVDKIASTVSINGKATKAAGAVSNADTVVTQCNLAANADNHTIIYTLTQ